MKMKCAKCGRETPFFVETYDPNKGCRMTFYYCEKHLAKVNRKMQKFNGAIA